MASKGLMKLFATMLLGSVVLISGMNVSAQDATGKVIGTITDQQGAVIAGAKITVTNAATQVTRNTVTNQDGYFEIEILFSIVSGNCTRGHVHPDAVPGRALMVDRSPLDLAH